MEKLVRGLEKSYLTNIVLQNLLSNVSKQFTTITPQKEKGRKAHTFQQSFCSRNAEQISNKI